MSCEIPLKAGTKVVVVDDNARKVEGEICEYRPADDLYLVKIGKGEAMRSLLRRSVEVTEKK